jgi:2-oxoglutarate/2-oxoacid ferredoxin oxidoreductase subunit alpha
MADYSIVLCGAAGAGIQTVEEILVKAFKLSGHNVFSTKEYMSRVRGGSNSTQIRVSDKPAMAPVDRIDIFLPLDGGALKHLRHRITKDTIVLGDAKNINSYHVIDAPFEDIASKLGSSIYANVVAAAAISCLFQIEKGVVLDLVSARFASKGEDKVKANVLAIDEGYSLGERIASENGLSYKIDKDNSLSGQILVKGSEALSLGVMAGGCDFISAYPMSPSTGILTFLAKYGSSQGVFVEQAEDEVSAVNMCVGAWYAGARALASTSGGGFALMEEGVSLAAMVESPIVVHVAQRPGPATGLPTRTAQEDLNLVLFSGHGEFPRAIYAPGSIEQAYSIGRKAFDIADKYQIPVFILTDQYLMDAHYNTPPFDVESGKLKKQIIKTDRDYVRYAKSESGISPRGIPGHGAGLVYADSDEHDNQGRITEDMDVRKEMVEKRLKKMDALKADSIAPEISSKDYDVAVVSWGSTKHIVGEAIEKLGLDGVASVHLSQLYPLTDEMVEPVKSADKKIMIEGNATSQFGRLMRAEQGIEFNHTFLKYDGLQFSVEEIVKYLREVL